MSELHVKGDSALFEAIRQEKAKRHARGLSDQPGELGDVAALKARWPELRQARATHYYHIVIEPTNGAYCAYPLTLPEVTTQGETPRAAKEKLAEALRAHLTEMRTQGQPLPVERKLVDTVEVSLP